MSYTEKELQQDIEKKYEHGFVSNIEQEFATTGLTEDTIRYISAKKQEPAFMLEWRLEAFRHWKTLEEPSWAHIKKDKINFQDLIYYAAPKEKKKIGSLDELDPEIKDTFDRLGISLDEQNRLANVAVDAVIDSVSVATTFQKKLRKQGVLFCSMSEAIRKYPRVIQQYLGSVVSYRDNFYAALNAAVFSDGSFCYIPKGVTCPMDLSTYFRINAANTGQFERTLVIADAGSKVNYLEGCTAPMRDEHQLHAAVVELIAHDDAEINYSTVQNWYPGDEHGKGGVYNFVTKRGRCDHRAKISWTQVETGSAITWKYPSVILAGDDSVGEFYSVAVTKHHQQADTGTKMIHKGKRSKSRIISKGISAGKSQNSYRGLVRILKEAEGAKNYSECDSLLLSSTSGAHTFPYIDVGNNSSSVEHEATTSRVSEETLYYLEQRGLSREEAMNLIVRGYCKEVFDKLPMEFASESQKLLELTLENSIG